MPHFLGYDYFKLSFFVLFVAASWQNLSKVVIPMQLNRQEPKRILRAFCALLLAAVMLLTPIFTIGAQAQEIRRWTTGATIHSATITATDRATYLTFLTSDKIQFAFWYTRHAVNLHIYGARAFPGAVSMSENPIFTSAVWNGNVLSLTLTTVDGFMGYHAFYDQSDNLIIRFRNPPSSLAVTRVVIDPGHGGQDRGAEGFRTDLPEAVLNRQVSNLLAEELRALGVTVLVLDTAPGMEIRERVRQAEQFDADIFISVHHNAARNTNATGTEVWYTTRFSRVLAATISRNVSTNIDTLNRGARRLNFGVTASRQFISVMVEVGFMSNRAEHDKLIDPAYQQETVRGITDAVVAIVNHSYPGTGRRFS